MSQTVSPYTYALLAAAVWGVSPLLEKLGLARADPMIGLIFRCTGVLIGMIPLFFFVPDLGSGFRSAGLRSALCFMTSGFLASVVGQVFALNALKRADASGVSPVMGAWPLFVALFGIFFLREPLNLRRISGAGLIVLGVWLLRA